MAHDVRNIRLADQGKLKIEWAGRQMPVLALIKKRFEKEKPLKGIRIAACLHVTSETANLMIALKAGGAESILCASNPLSTQDDVAASLVKNYKIPTFAIKGEDNKTYYRHLRASLAHKPQLTMDDGADLVSEIHGKQKNLADNILGSTEETTTGVIRLRSLEAKGLLLFPVIAVNDAQTKHFFDNRYGTGQSTIDGVLRATNILMSGSVFVVCGYGWCGRGLAQKARGMGAQVIVVETDPMKALEAVMDGFQVMSLAQASRVGNVFVTVTGNLNVIRKEHFLNMKNGAIIANSGHFNAEIDLPALKKVSKRSREVRPFVTEFELRDGRKINLIADGRLVNLSAAEGHPAAVMDMSFANQALSAEYVVKSGSQLERRVYAVPEPIDKRIAFLKLQAMGIQIDKLTKEQVHYLASWEMGT